jgi:hypothetical protein
VTEETALRIAAALEALVMILHGAVGEEAEAGPLMVMTQQGMVQVGK